MSTDIRILDDPRAECAALVAAALPRGPVVLTGGSTNRAYADVPRAAWAGTELWFSDERCVPVDDERSNYGALVGAVGDALVDAQVHRIAGEDGPEAAAKAHEHSLREHDIVGRGFELFLIGLGPDGHICSMFPGQSSLDEHRRLCVGVPEAGLEPYVPRVTLTFGAIALARHVVVMAAGEGKADAVAGAFAEDAPASRDLPGSLLGEYAQRITVLTDEAGASRL
ncbi:MAG TPA: 6-phosphogluconolactonase [Solirubrobacteraceae bacterium]|nr:6-phosphogluconolactonase [Solirubrobacteraceae bacterium]